MNPVPLVLATRNAGKQTELAALLAHFAVEVRGLQDFPALSAVEEDGDSFEANALKKARFTAARLGLPCLADDSGLMVAALNGQPGVYSARFAGPGASDADNVHRLLSLMAGIADRQACFVCVLALCLPNGASRLYEGRCEGRITLAPRGTGGFGYDPVFFFPPLARTFAELQPSEKNAVSHRGLALAKLREDFARVLAWMETYRGAWSAGRGQNPAG